MYTCNICEKTFCRKYHLERHENNKKRCVRKIEHKNITLKNEELMSKNEELMSKNEENMDKKVGFICEYCNREYSRKDNLNRHVEKYCRNVKNEKGMLIELIHENKKILDKMRDIEDKVINNPPIITTHITHNNNTHTNNNNIHVTNNIMNFNDLNYDIDKTFMYNCLKNGLPGDIEYLRRVYLDNIPHECRPVRCLDPSRDKCMVRKNGEWIASTGREIYRQSLKRLIDNYLRINNSMLEESEGKIIVDMDTTGDNIINEVENYRDNDSVDIHEYLSEYSTIENETTTKNVKIDEYVHNLNRITRMMEDKNVDKVSRHMNILLK